MRKFTALFLLFAVSHLLLMAQPVWDAVPKQEPGFIENKGQVMDQRGNVNKDVRFMYADRLFNLQLKKDGFSYELFQVTNDNADVPESGLQDQNNNEFTDLASDHRQLHSHRIDVKFEGANAKAEISGESSTGITFNYYTWNTPPEGITGVQSFNKVKYKNIYPGIDLVFSAPDEATDALLKYEWIVHPGADPAKIKLQYSGATALIPTVEEGFKLYTATGTIDESKVIAFVENDHSPVDAGYRFNGNTIGYDISIDKKNTIVIDPNIVWASYYGGELSEDINNGELAVDKQTKVIITGSTFSTQYIASSGAHQTSYAGGYHDGIVAKFSTTGELLWATYYGGADKDEGHAITTDNDNNVYVAGLTTSPGNISTPGSYQPVKSGIQDAFVVKFNGSGVRLWATYLGGSVQDQILDMDCDKKGTLYFTGYTVSPNGIATPGAHQDTMNNSGGSNGDAFLGAFSSTGQLKWCSYFSGPAQDRAHGICVGKNGDLFIEGTCESKTQFATAGAHQSTYGGGGTDAFIAKWDTSGHLYWCSYVGGTAEEHGRGVKTDKAGNPYMIGWSASSSGIATPGAVQEDWFEAYDMNGLPKYDCFLIKFKADGSRQWGTYYGGFGKDQGFAITIDDDNDYIYYGGLTLSPQNIATSDGYQPAFQGTSDGFLAKFEFDGTRVWGSYFGSGDNEEVHGLELDKNGFMYLLLSTTGGDFSVTPDAYQTTVNGGDETIVVRFNVADSCYDKYEPNNSGATPKVIKAFDNVNLWGYTGAIATSTDADWYKVKLSEVTNLKVELTDLNADYDLKLYKNNGQLLFTSANAGTADEAITYNSAPKASYLLEIVHNSAVFDPNNCYRIRPLVSTTPWLMKEGEESMQSQSSSLLAQVFPNPTADNISIKISSLSSQQVQVNVYNMLRQRVHTDSYEVAEGVSSIQIPAQDFSPGIYLVEVTNHLVKTELKVVVQ